MAAVGTLTVTTLIICYCCVPFTIAVAQETSGNPRIGRDNNGNLHFNSTVGGKIFVNGEEFVSITRVNDMEARLAALESSNAANQGRWAGYPVWDGDLDLTGEGFSSSLLPLFAGVTNITGNLKVNTVSRNTLDALSSLTTIGGDLHIDPGTGLTNIDGLSALTSVGNDLYITSTSLTNLDGLAQLKSIGRKLKIRSNDALEDVAGLMSVTYIGHEIEVINNDVLTSLSGLESVTSVVNTINVCENKLLTQIPVSLASRESSSFKLCPGDCAC